MSMLERIPTLADDDLATLGRNAERLAQKGTPKQQQAATTLLPAITAELAVRREASLARKKATSEAARAKRKAK